MIFILISCLAWIHAALPPRPVPRTSSHLFVESGTFEGGSPLSANLEGIRFSRNPKDSSERWVIDFSDARTRTYQQIAPEFQVRLVPETKWTPARILIYLSSIKANYLEPRTLKTLLRKSHLIQNIRIYPPIEDGDRAIELILKETVLWEPNQPLQKEGRLVLDLKPKP